MRKIFQGVGFYHLAMVSFFVLAVGCSALGLATTSPIQIFRKKKFKIPLHERI